MVFCSLAYLAMMDWNHIEAMLAHKVAMNKLNLETLNEFKKFRSRLDKVMSGGYMEFIDNADEDRFMIQANLYIYKY